MQSISFGSAKIEDLRIEQAGEEFCCSMKITGREGARSSAFGKGPTVEAGIVEAMSMICKQPIRLRASASRQLETSELIQVSVELQGRKNELKLGVGSGVAQDSPTASVIAVLRAANQGGLLKKEFCAPHQKVLRGMAREFAEESISITGFGDNSSQSLQEIESLALSYFNRVASAAVLTAENAPEGQSPLQFFDHSSWLYDSSGHRRKHNTETDLWLAWYPGLDDDDRIIGEVLETMPASPASAIPWIVRLFENPESFFRFRGAQDLEDHDVLHVLLGRGLQDQDEAFVLGFAMGTAKQVSWLQFRIFKYALAHWYPEPYRVPPFLQPAFDLGVACGKATGRKNLYKQPLKQMKHFSIRDAREALEIDVQVVKKYFRIEQERIPFTMASMRLP